MTTIFFSVNMITTHLLKVLKCLILIKCFICETSEGKYSTCQELKIILYAMVNILAILAIILEKTSKQNSYMNRNN